MKNRPFKTAVFIILFAVFMFSLFQVIKINCDYKEAEDSYAELQGMYVKVVEEELQPPDTSDKDSMPQPTEAPFTGLDIDFDALISRNPEVKGWIYCPDTVINYPVVQAKDNEKYLHGDIDGKYLKSGTLFVDARNGALTDDLNYIIYGHNMKNGSMFGPLMKYKDPAYYEEHPLFYYFTPEGDYVLELFAGLVIDGDDPLYHLSAKQQENFLALISEYRRRSTFASQVQIGRSDTIVTLSTCSYERDDARYVVLARLAPFVIEEK